MARVKKPTYVFSAKMVTLRFFFVLIIRVFLATIIAQRLEKCINLFSH